nr:hypothetical protein [Tanacetum cinerariifolium]
MEITTTIDGKIKVVTEASVRRHLKLEDSDGISILPTTEIFEQLALMGTFNFSKMIFDGMVKNFDSEGLIVPVESHHTPTGAPSTSPPHYSSPPRSFIRQETKVPQPSSPTHTHVADEAISIGVDVRHGGAATTITSLDAGQGSGNIDKIPSMPHHSPLPRVNTLGSDEGRMQHNELMDLVTKLSDKVLALVTDLKQTKKEVDFENPSKKWRSMIEEINQDAEVTLVTPTQTYTRRRAVKTGSGGVSTASRMISTVEESVSTAGASMPISTAGMVDKERQRMARVHEAAQTFTEEEWENIRGRVKSDEELTQRLKAEERNKYNEVDQAKELFESTMRSIKDFVPMKSEDDKAVPKLAEARSLKRDAEQELDQEIYTEDARKYWKIIRVGNHTEAYQFFDNMLKVFDREGDSEMCRELIRKIFM